MQVFQHVGEILLVVEHIGVDILEDRLFIQIKTDHFRHIGIHRFIVGHTGTDSIRQRNASGTVGAHQSRHAQHRIGAEGFRIDEVVVDAPVDHIDFLRPLGGAHEHGVVLHKQVNAFDQLDPHLLCKEGMFEVGGVEVARCHQYDGRVIDADRRGIAQGLQQQIRIVIDRPHALRGKQFREQAHHHPAVLEQVGHTGRRAQIVFEHVVFAVRILDQIDTGDMGVNVSRHIDADHFRTELGILDHLVGGHLAGAQDFLIVINIVQESV